MLILLENIQAVFLSSSTDHFAKPFQPVAMKIYSNIPSVSCTEPQSRTKMMSIVTGLVTPCSYSNDFQGKELGSWVPLSYVQGSKKILIVQTVAKTFTGVFTLFLLYHCLQHSFFLNTYKQRLSDTLMPDSIHTGLSIHYTDVEFSAVVAPSLVKNKWSFMQRCSSIQNIWYCCYTQHMK